MKYLKELVRNHRIAILLAVITALLVALPQVYFRIDHKDDGVYQGIELLPDSPWSARAREVQDGHPWFGNIYNKDGKDEPYLFQPLGSMVVAYMGELFGLDINNTLLLSRLILTPLVFLLTYGFVFLISRDKLASLCSAITILLVDSVMSLYGVTHLLSGVSPDNFLRIARPVNPAMIYILFFGFLIPFWLYFKGRGKKYGVISAVLLGLNFYNYFYSWTFLYAFGGFVVLLYLLQKKWHEALRLMWVFVGAFVGAIPYIVNLYNAAVHDGYEEVSARFGMVLSHTPLFIGVVATVGIVLFLFKFPREDRERYVFALALLVTPIATMNQQIFTGKVLQPSHYHWFFHKPIVVIFVIVILFQYMAGRTRLSSYRLLCGLSIIAISLMSGLFIQMDSYYNGNKDGGQIAIERQKYGPVMQWLNQNVEKEAVVFGNDETSHMTVIYTPLNVFYHRAMPFASLTATRERQLEVMFTFYRLRGIDADTAPNVFELERTFVSGQVYGIYYREVYGSYDAIPDEKLTEIVNAYIATLATPASKWLHTVLQKYEVEYVIWDRKKDPDWEIPSYNFFTEVAVFDDISIYRFLPLK